MQDLECFVKSLSAVTYFIPVMVTIALLQKLMHSLLLSEESNIHINVLGYQKGSITPER